MRRSQPRGLSKPKRSLRLCPQHIILVSESKNLRAVVRGASLSDRAGPYLAHFLIIMVLEVQVVGGGHLVAPVIIVIRI